MQMSTDVNRVRRILSRFTASSVEILPMESRKSSAEYTNLRDRALVVPGDESKRREPEYQRERQARAVPTGTEKGQQAEGEDQ